MEDPVLRRTNLGTSDWEETHGDAAGVDWKTFFFFLRQKKMVNKNTANLVTYKRE